MLDKMKNINKMLFIMIMILQKVLIAIENKL